MSTTSKKIENAFDKGFNNAGGTFRGGLVQAIISAGPQGLTSEIVLELLDSWRTGPVKNPRKLARQNLRKARWHLLEKGYQLAFKDERLDGGFKVYRAIKCQKGTGILKLCKKLEITPYSVKKVA